MERTLIKNILEHIGQKVMVKGWVITRRDHGKIIFLDVEDESKELLQVVFGEKLYDRVKEFNQDKSHPAVVTIEGEIAKRPEKMSNPKLPTGSIELKASKLETINLSNPLPIPTDNEGYEINEEKRLKYRYLDLRRQRMRQNLVTRHKTFQFIRNYLSALDFVEIETPVLSKSTPEGARDFIVPARLHPGKFFALPQSPQQYKQLLMVARIGKYFQITKCFRDEDTRGDRQPEFTQLDIEMPFVSQNDVLTLIENLYIKILEELFPDKKITEKPFPRLKYSQVIKKYKTDSPDLRKDKNNKDELAFCFVTDFPMFEEREDGSLSASHHPFTLPTFDTEDNPEEYQHETSKSKELIKILDTNKKEELLKLSSYQYDLVCNGNEIGGGSIRIYNPQLLKQIFIALGNEPEDVDRKFAHIFEAFSYGVPPHGGIAMGLDRFVALLQNEPNIREVIAFPKTGDAYDPMMNSPSEITKAQLKEIHLKIEKEKE